MTADDRTTPAASDTASPPSNRGCLTCLVAFLILTVLLAVAVLLLLPRVRAGVAFGFAEVLRTQAAAQERYREDVLRDDDEDGVGEYLFVADMPLTAAGPQGQPPEPGYGIAPRLQEKVIAAEGLIPLGVCTLRIYLPGPDGSWLGDDGRSPGAAPALSDGREQAFVMYAWPEGDSWLADRVLVIDQGGTVHWADTEPPEGGQWYSPEHPPEAAAAYPTPRAALEGPLSLPAEGALGQDGRLWRPLE